MNEFGYGQMSLDDASSEVNAIAFMIRAMMARMSTMKLVKVIAVHPGDGDPGPAGTVDVLPLVNQVDGNNNSMPHGTVYGIPWFRIQGGGAAIICDPAVDDVGYVVVSDRDISAVKTSGGKQSNPGSFRKFDLADGIYVGGCLNAAPTSYVRFKADGGLKIVDGHGNVLETTAGGFELTPAAGGAFKVTGNIQATGTIIAGFGGADQVSLQTHVHPTAALGAPSPPTPGT